jgi:hypothetical protein
LYEAKNHITDLWFFACYCSALILPDFLPIASQSANTSGFGGQTSDGAALATPGLASCLADAALPY